MRLCLKLATTPLAKPILSRALLSSPPTASSSYSISTGSPNQARIESSEWIPAFSITPPGTISRRTVYPVMASQLYGLPSVAVTVFTAPSPSWEMIS